MKVWGACDSQSLCDLVRHFRLVSKDASSSVVLSDFRLQTHFQRKLPLHIDRNFRILLHSNSMSATSPWAYATTTSSGQSGVKSSTVCCGASTRGDAAYKREMNPSISTYERRECNKVVHCPNPTDNCDTARKFKEGQK